MQPSLDQPLGGSRRIPQLDGLRGIAIAMVLAYHYAATIIGPAPKVLGGVAAGLNLGWSGVDLFFVLSGFLIGGILLDARESRNYFSVFYRRRVCRIFPIYFVFLAAFAVSAHFVHEPDVRRLFLPAIPWPASATFTQNIWMAIHNNEGPPTLNPTWSLAIEEQFYLTLPAIVYFVKPRRLIWILAGGMILAPLLRLGIFLADPRRVFAIVVLLPCRMDSLLFGVTAAWLLRRPGAREFLQARRKQLWTAIELLLLVCALFLFSPSTYSPPVMLVGFDCLGLLYAAILVACLVDDGLARLLRVKWLMALGTISYGVYLIHELMFGMSYALVSRWTNSWAITASVALALTLGIAWTSWNYFEKPLVAFGHRARYEFTGAATPGHGGVLAVNASEAVGESQGRLADNASS